MILLWLILSLAHAQVDNPKIFLGQQGFGLTSGAPISLDANQQVISGISAQEVSSTTSTTCGTTAGNITGMTSTPAAGTWMVIFSSDFTSAVSGTVLTLQYTVGGTALTISQRKAIIFSGGTLTFGSQRMIMGLNAMITVSGSQAVTVQCQTSANTVTTGAAQMQMVRLN